MGFRSGSLKVSTMLVSSIRRCGRLLRSLALPFIRWSGPGVPLAASCIAHIRAFPALSRLPAEFRGRGKRAGLPRSRLWTRVCGPCPECRQKILAGPEACSFFWATLSLGCFWYSRWRRVQLWHRVSSGMEGAPHSTQIPRSLAFSLLCCMLRRFSSLRSGVWDLWRSYSRRVSFLASTSVDVGWARGFVDLCWGSAWDVAFLRLVGFCLALGFAAVFLAGCCGFLGLSLGFGHLEGEAIDEYLSFRTVHPRGCG